MKRRGGHQANNSRAIRVSNQTPLSQLNPSHSLGIHFRYHKGHILIHPKRRAIIHHDRPALHRDRPELLADRSAGAEQRDVDAAEALGGELLDDVALVLEGDALAGGALGGEQFDGAVGEGAVGEDGEKFLADGAGDADDGEGGGGFAEGHADGEGGGVGAEGGGEAGEGCGSGEEAVVRDG